MIKRALLFLSLLAVTVLAAGCGKADHHESHGEHDHAPGGELRLDDGKKWPADNHTRESMESIRRSLSEAGESASQERRGLSTQLKQQVDELIRGCTMTGDAHNQLHIFLDKLIPEVERLAEQGEEAGKKTMERIRELIAEYDRHFE
jgi:hypothetical protein